MIAYQIDESGICSTCRISARDQDVVMCLDCKNKFHADCDNTRPSCTNRSFLDTHIRMSRNNTNNFPFICDHCLTRRENNEASSLKEQLAAVVKSLAVLTQEVQSIKQSKLDDNQDNSADGDSDTDRRNGNSSQNVRSEKENDNNRGVWYDSKRLENV